ncbi:MAG TPA: energy transducer TonB [Gemmatimonadaceae bacterium]
MTEGVRRIRSSIHTTSNYQVFLLVSVISGCATAHPLKPIVPVYPEAIRTANAQGRVTARFKIAETGEPGSIKIDVDTASSGLLESSVRSTLLKTRFAPARLLGFARSSELHYVFDFVLFRPKRALGPDEKWLGVDHFPAKCPVSQKERRVIVCGEAVPTISKSVF